MIWIIAALSVLFVCETILTEIEQWGWATITLLGTMVAAHFLHLFRINEFVAEHGWDTVLYVVAYLGIGVLWSFVKWFSYLRRFRDTFREYKVSFCKERNLDVNKPIPKELINFFKENIRRSIRSGVPTELHNQISYLEKPKAADNKARIMAWMAYWPCSALGTLLNDPVRRAFNWLFNNFKALYQKMSDWMFRKDVELR